MTIIIKNKETLIFDNFIFKCSVGKKGITSKKNEGDNYSILLGPIENIDANKLVSSFISKGYNKTEIILE